MKQRIRQKRGRRRYLYAIAMILCGLVGLAVLFWWLPFTPADCSRLLLQIFGKDERSVLLEQDEKQPLRGTIYDRNFTELAVSYRLYNLYVHPAELKRKQEAAGKLASLTGGDQDALLDMFRFSQRAVKIADGLDGHQAAAIASLGMAGVFLMPVEQRFYPAHTAAAHLVGFTEKDRGLAGVEAWFDTVLQPGAFRSDEVQGLILNSQELLGRTTSDIVLTVDLDIQRRVEQKLRESVQAMGGGKGMAMVLEPASGRLLALAGWPSLNPNYFWLADEQARRMKPGCLQLDPSMLRPLLQHAAAVWKYDEPDDLLPETVAAPGYGLSEDDYNSYIGAIGLSEDIDSLLTTCPGQNSADYGSHQDRNGKITAMQAAVTLASQINGGWRYTPFFLESVYDHETSHFFPYRFDQLKKKHVLSPALGVRVRRELLLNSLFSGKQGLVYAKSQKKVIADNGLSRYLLEDLVTAATPLKNPQILFFMLIRRNNLEPLPAEDMDSERMLAAVAGELMPILHTLATREEIADLPVGKNEENFRRFLISRRIDYKETDPVPVQGEQIMPSLVGLSLRKALQRLNRYEVRVRIQGSGRIVSQQPKPGSLLNGETECKLVLQSIQ